MSWLAEAPWGPAVVLIEDEFSSLPADERSAAFGTWLESLRSEEPIELPVSGAELVAEARAEAGW